MRNQEGFSPPEGFVLVKYANGDVYKGEFRSGNPNGKGVYLFANGVRIEGDFDGSEFDRGWGTIKYPDGSVYTGDFDQGTPNGHGVLNYANGTRFEGTFIDGKPLPPPLLPPSPPPPSPPQGVYR